MEFLCGELLTKVSRAREAELEASGRAAGLQYAVEAMRGEIASLRATNEMLIGRAFGGTPTPTYARQFDGPMPDIVGGVPVGSLRPSNQRGPMPLETFDPALPVMGAAPKREQAMYAGGDMREMNPFDDIGDDEAKRRGIQEDELTGTLTGTNLHPAHS